MNDALNTAAVTAQPKVYEVVNLDRAKEKFEKLSRRAKKLGVAPAGFEVIGEHTEYEVRERGSHGQAIYTWSKRSRVVAEAQGYSTAGYTGSVRKVHHVVLKGAAEVKLAGWAFLATLDHELGEDSTIVRLVPGADGQLPKDYRHRGNVCDHCKRSQARKQTYVCKHEDGRLVQVGSTCIKDFLGHEAEHALGLVEMYALAAGYLEDDEMFRQREPDTFDLVEYLAWTCKAIREDGWVSRKEARESGSDHSTADAALYLMTEFRHQR